MHDVAFRVDAGAELGAGHLARCAALATAMAGRGWRTTLYGTRETIALAAKLEGFAATMTVETAAAADPAAIDGLHDVAVVDHYGLDAGYEAALRKRIGCVVALCDFPDRRHAVDLVVDQNLARRAEDYAAFVDSRCVVMAGSNYVLLQSVYRRFERTGARRVRDTAKNLLVTFGASDPEDATAAAFAQLCRTARPEWRIRLILGPAYARADALHAMARGRPAVEIVRAPPDLLSAMRWADAAITAAGGTCWELCYMAVPFAVATLGKTPNTNARRLQELGAAVDLGGSEALRNGSLDGVLGVLMGPPEARQAMATRGHALIDGRGVDRICDWIEKRLCAR